MRFTTYTTAAERNCTAGHPLYSGIFFADGTHMTYEFKPGNPSLPKGVSEGQRATVKVIGTYEDEQVACLIVKYGSMTKQPGGTLLHITTKADGAKPVESGKRATQKGYERCKPYSLNGTWKIFRSNR